jgi:hypothetical protein
VQGTPTIYSDGFRSLDPFSRWLVHPGDVRCEEDARRFRGEDDKRNTETELSDKADWYQERGSSDKKSYVIDRICGSPSFVGAAAAGRHHCLPDGSPRHRNTRIYAGITGIIASQAPSRERNKNQISIIFDCTIMRAALVLTEAVTSSNTLGYLFHAIDSHF